MTILDNNQNSCWNCTHSEKDLRNYLAFAQNLTTISRKIISDKISQGFKSELKSDNSFVTEVDTAVEVALRSEIQLKFGEHGVFGEELPSINPSSPWRWVLDPIDGTLSFKQGIPLFGTLISLEYCGHPVVGVIDLPAINRTLSAAKGLGCYCNDKQLIIEDLSNESEITERQEVIARCDRANFLRSGVPQLMQNLDLLHPRVRAYSDCFGHALAIMGAVGAMIDFNICWWDIAATKILVEEAKGKFEVVELSESPNKPTRYSILLGKPLVVGYLLEQLKLQVVKPELYLGSSKQIIG